MTYKESRSHPSPQFWGLSRARPCSEGKMVQRTFSSFLILIIIPLVVELISEILNSYRLSVSCCSSESAFTLLLAGQKYWMSVLCSIDLSRSNSFGKINDLPQTTCLYTVPPNSTISCQAVKCFIFCKAVQCNTFLSILPSLRKFLS